LQMPPKPPSYADPDQFLWDGLKERVSQGLLILGEEAHAQQFAQLLHEHGSGTFRAAAPGAGLLAIEAASVSGVSRGHAEKLCQEARDGGHWLYLGRVGRLLDSTGGRNMLEAVCEAMAKASLPCVIASSAAGSDEQLADDLCRLLGLVPTARLDTNGKLLGVSELSFLMAQAEDRGDTGWSVAVRYQLRSPIKDPPDLAPDERADSALRMVDTIRVAGERADPVGALIGFRADAFGVGQRRAVFDAAEVVARRIVGRKVAADELVEARRGFCFV
jgi:hypothetical protein